MLKDFLSLIRNIEVNSKFLDKPSENKFSWSFRSGKANKSELSFAFPLTYS